jgi:ABC-type sugar transport system ATPase subunit
MLKGKVGSHDRAHVPTYGRAQTTVLVTHGVHHLPIADKVIVMDAGKITHFGSFEQVRDAGATFALTSAGELAAKNGQVVAKKAATAPTVVDEEKDEELNWTREQASRWSAYAFYTKCTGVLRASGLLLLITIWSGTQIFAMVYLSSMRFLYASAIIHHLSACILGRSSWSLGSRIWSYCREHVCLLFFHPLLMLNDHRLAAWCLWG